MTEKQSNVKRELDIWRAKLAMHDNVIPCFLETLVEDPCPKLAEYLVYYGHLLDSECETPALPVCAEHLAVLKLRDGIWADWFGEAPLECMKCDGPVKILKVERI